MIITIIKTTSEFGDGDGERGRSGRGLHALRSMPGPKEPAHRGWLGVVTGIRLIQISTGGFLVFINPRQRRYVFVVVCLSVCLSV